MPEPLGKINSRLTNWLEWVGLLAIFFMILVTCVDVIGAKVFLRPVFGAIDIVMICQLIAIAFSAGATLLAGKHVQVDFLVIMLPKRIQAAVDAFIHLLGLALFVVIVWRLAVYGYSLQIRGEVSSTARIPLYFFAYSTAVACTPVCLIMFNELLKSLFTAGKK